MASQSTPAQIPLEATPARRHSAVSASPHQPPPWDAPAVDPESSRSCQQRSDRDPSLLQRAGHATAELSAEEIDHAHANLLEGSASVAKPSRATESAAATSSHAWLPDTGFVRQHQVLLLVPVSKSTLWRRVRSKSFPAPVKLSAHVTAWRAEDIRRWIREQGREDGSGAA
jgi:prophage regulatory protein